MQYSYVQAIVKPKARGSRWQSEDVQAMTLETLLNEYADARIELSHSALSEPQTLSLDAMRPRVADLSLTFNQWLSGLGNSSLPTTEGRPELKNETVFHLDAWMAGFDVQPTRMGSHPEQDWNVDGEKDLLLTKDGVDYADLQRHCLVTVNGLIHQTSASEAGLYVVNGGQARLRSNETQIALTSFASVGALEVVNLTKDMLYRPREENRYYQQAHLNLGVSTEHKSVLLVLGGYLHAFDDVYRSIGDGLIQIDFNNYPMIQRYYESRDILDLSSLPLQTFEQNESQRSVEDLLKNEAVIEAFLSLGESFAIVVDTPNLYVKKHQLEKSGLVGTFLTHQKPRWPLMTQRGKLKEYWAYEDDGVWVMNCESNLLPNYQFEHTHYQTLASVVAHKVPSKPYYHDRGFLLEIGKDF